MIAAAATAASSPGALWYLTRGTGVVAMLLLTVSVGLGIASTIGVTTEGWPRFLTTAVHRTASLLSIAFVAVHVLTTVADSYAPITIVDAFIPFVSRYRPVWLGLGALAFDLLLAVAVTSIVRRRLGYRSWRAVHWLAYAAWPIALVHLLGTGSDAKSWWLDLVAVVSTLAVAATIGWRLVEAGSGRVGERLALGAVTVLVPIGVLVWWTGGPGAPGWAARAGTPTALIAHAAPVARSAPRTPAHAATPAPLPLPKAPFDAGFRGTISESAPDGAGLVTVTITGRTTGKVVAVLRISIRGIPASGGGVSMTASRAQLGLPARPVAYRGPVTSLTGTDLAASLTAPAAPPIDLTVHLQLAANGNAVTGSVHAAHGTSGAGRSRA